jgi:hypothetical protein
MANDIMVIDSSKPINVEYSVCSTLPTGYRTKLLKFGYYSNNLTIASIQAKYETRFDDPSYYYGSTGGTGLDPNVTIIGG